jgi:hypothetical protein
MICSLNTPIATPHEGPMEYPKGVRVVYPDGAEERGLAIDPLHVDVGPMGRQVKPREVVKIDGVPHLVADARSKPGDSGSDEISVRLRVKPIPGWLTAEDKNAT